MTCRLAWLFMVPLIIAPLFALTQNSAKEKAAAAAAEKWLGLVDKGEYARSWKEASSCLRKGTPEQKWGQTASTFRAPLGKLIERQVADAECRTSPTGALGVQYVLMHYYTSFEKRKAAYETVVTVLDKDGKWRVASYFIW